MKQRHPVGNDRTKHGATETFGSHLKRAFIDGAVIVVPIATIVLLTLSVVRRLQDAAHPLVGHVVHPLIVAIAALVLIVLAFGLLVRSAPGRWVQRRMEAWIFERVPGYKLAKAFASEQILGEGDGRTIRPALATIEDGQCPAFVMDELADGRLLVFVPGSPAPMAGALYIFTADKVQILDIPVMPFVQAISSWGLGMADLLQSSLAAKPGQYDPPPSGSN
ncbi:Uncharacterized membrane protein [Kaistia soli DSM 19436]|uniref:Uncharacterized membrane protein n=1 Tax=Kaistia soli DSM 19436 TaxID=1122133 RepID=A0A1M5FH52_9HYPH|nr:DUF502 domain-containing protein [Kaistia soli]SHF90471.1 Uncharacterized membrane protein [Kaistia soli DSM 19436]